MALENQRVIHSHLASRIDSIITVPRLGLGLGLEFGLGLGLEFGLGLGLGFSA